LLEKLEIRNYRSIAHATVELRPFTLLVGANGSGKSNLLSLLQDATKLGRGQPIAKHFSHSVEPTLIRAWCGGPKSWNFGDSTPGSGVPRELQNVRVFAIDPSHIAGAESLSPTPEVKADGQGAIQVLDSLKTGDREDLFLKIEASLRDFIPEIEKLSFIPGTNEKRLQVREAHIATPVPVSELSEGTRLVLTILTIIFQERRPTIIGLEDLDRGLHPRLFGQVVETCRTLVRDQKDVQIIATTHNPYLVDEFIDDEESVLVVEKVDANTSFTKLSDKLRGLETGDETLGGKWYAGLVGGVPVRRLAHVPTGVGGAAK
jgi:predicted ATPase